MDIDYLYQTHITVWLNQKGKTDTKTGPSVDIYISASMVTGHTRAHGTANKHLTCSRKNKYVHNTLNYFSWTVPLGGHEICRIILKRMQQKQVLMSVTWSEMVQDNTQEASVLNSSFYYRWLVNP
jgi:hypothetical protein